MTYRKLTHTSKISSKKKHGLYACIEGYLFLLVAVIVLLWGQVTLNPCSGILFAQVFCAFVFAFLVFHFSRKKNRSRLWSLVFSFSGIAVVFLLLYYHVWGIGWTAAVGIGLGYHYPRTKTAPQRIRFIEMGILSLLALAGMMIAIFQFAMIFEIQQFRHLDHTLIQSIEMQRESDNVIRIIDSPVEIRKITSSFFETRPYYPHRESIERNIPWSMTIRFKEIKKKPLKFRIGNGNRRTPMTVWLDLHLDYENARMYKVLMSEISPSLW